MPSIRVEVTGTEKENVSSVTLGATRWGENGIEWSAAGDVTAGQTTGRVVYFGGKTPSDITVTIQATTQRVTITAGGQGNDTAVAA